MIKLTVGWLEGLITTVRYREPAPFSDASGVGDPQPVGTVGMEIAVYEIGF